MARENAYTRFLKDPDTGARRAELEAFVGHNTAPFLTQYERLRERPERPGFRAITSFVAMAFFLGPCWFFYRRMWIWAWGIVAVLIVIAFIPGSSRAGVPVAVSLALFGRYSYLTRAAGIIETLRGGAATADLEALRRAGGVSRIAGWASAAVYLLLLVVAVASAILFVSAGGDPEQLR